MILEIRARLTCHPIFWGWRACCFLIFKVRLGKECRAEIILSWLHCNVIVCVQSIWYCALRKNWVTARFIFVGAHRLRGGLQQARKEHLDGNVCHVKLNSYCLTTPRKTRHRTTDVVLDTRAGNPPLLDHSSETLFYDYWSALQLGCELKRVPSFGKVSETDEYSRTDTDSKSAL